MIKALAQCLLNCNATAKVHELVLLPHSVPTAPLYFPHILTDLYTYVLVKWYLSWQTLLNFQCWRELYERKQAGYVQCWHTFAHRLGSCNYRQTLFPPSGSSGMETCKNSGSFFFPFFVSIMGIKVGQTLSFLLLLTISINKMFLIYKIILYFIFVDYLCSKITWNKSKAILKKTCKRTQKLKGIWRIRKDFAGCSADGLGVGGWWNTEKKAAGRESQASLSSGVKKVELTVMNSAILFHNIVTNLNHNMMEIVSFYCYQS